MFSALRYCSSTSFALRSIMPGIFISSTQFSHIAIVTSILYCFPLISYCRSIFCSVYKHSFRHSVQKLYLSFFMLSALPFLSIQLLPNILLFFSNIFHLIIKIFQSLYTSYPLFLFSFLYDNVRSTIFDIPAFLLSNPAILLWIYLHCSGLLPS